MSKVTKCMCEECKYNDSFACQADGIEIRSSAEGYKVVSPEGTSCSTFEHASLTTL